MILKDRVEQHVMWVTAVVAESIPSGAFFFFNFFWFMPLSCALDVMTQLVRARWFSTISLWESPERQKFEL